MGQRSSSLPRPKISLARLLRGSQNQEQQKQMSRSAESRLNFGQENPADQAVERDGESGKDRLKWSRKKHERRRSETLRISEKAERLKNPLGDNTEKEISWGVFPLETTRSEKDGLISRSEEKAMVKRATSEPTLMARESIRVPPAYGKDERRHGRARRSRKSRSYGRFCYEIADIDAFLTKASIEKPANIPVVLSFPSVLYQTQGGTQDEIALPLGTIVNAIFKNQTWLYVQTPHGQEGYVFHAACLPLGILPRPKRAGPCWEDSTDIFPRPLGNVSEAERLRGGTWSECGNRDRRKRRSRVKLRTQRDNYFPNEEDVGDQLFVNVDSTAKGNMINLRKTLFVIGNDYDGQDENSVSVKKGDVVGLLGEKDNDWYWVYTHNGGEGLIPASVVGHVINNDVS